MNTNENDGVLWWLFYGIAALAGIINITNVFKTPKVVSELEKIIAEQDKMIDAQQKIINEYLKK